MLTLLPRCLCFMIPVEDGKMAVYVSLQAREGFGNERILDYVLKCIYKEIDERSKLLSIREYSL